jgi:hypothetical protein
VNGLAINTNPVHKQRPIYVRIYNTSNQLVFEGRPAAAATQVFGTGRYRATVSLPYGWQSGYYIVKVRLDYTLWKVVQGISTIMGGQVNILPTASLMVGDINEDNTINILDYNLLLNCYSDLAPPTGPCNGVQKRAADLTDDGSVNQFDYNLFLRGMRAQGGS